VAFTGVFASAYVSVLRQSSWRTLHKFLFIFIYFNGLFSSSYTSTVSFRMQIRLFYRVRFMCIRVFVERILFAYYHGILLVHIYVSFAGFSVYTLHLSIHSCICLFCRSLLQVSFARPFAYKSLSVYFTPLYSFMYMSLLQVSFAGLFCKPLCI